MKTRRTPVAAPLCPGPLLVKHAYVTSAHILTVTYSLPATGTDVRGPEVEVFVKGIPAVRRVNGNALPTSVLVAELGGSNRVELTYGGADLVGGELFAFQPNDHSVRGPGGAHVGAQEVVSE